MANQNSCESTGLHCRLKPMCIHREVICYEKYHLPYLTRMSYQIAHALTRVSLVILQARAKTFEASEADVLSNSTDVLFLNSLAINEMSLDRAPQAIYDACEPTEYNWEISRERVNLTKEIGKGAFCQVAKADAWNLRGIKGLTTVAVKMLKGDPFSGPVKQDCCFVSQPHLSTLKRHFCHNIMGGK